MKYRDILGFSKKRKSKKKVNKENLRPLRPTVTDVLKEEFGDTFSTKKLYEGPAYEYAKYIKKIDKFEKAYHDAVEDFELFLYKKKGLKKEARALNIMSVKIQKQWGNFWNKVVKSLL